MTSGAAAEQLAADHLRDLGMVIVERNYRCRGGEIDIVGRDGDTLVFVEVRLRRSEHFGGAAASITARKRRRLRFAALHYLSRLGTRARGGEPDCRFDAVLLDSLSHEGIRWLRNIDSE